MANWLDWTPEKEAAWQEWIATRPAEIQELAKQFPPYKLFLLKTTKHRCFVVSYAEDGTLRVQIDGRFNLITFSRQVFGINPKDLIECDLPPASEPVGDISEE